jgi:hypothetical protein
MDKVVDWLIGDSPSSSFALVCEKCKANNGLAPVDEMDGIRTAAVLLSPFSEAAFLTFPLRFG